MDKGILEGSAIRRAIEKTGPKIKVTSDQAKEIIKKYKATQKQIAKEKNEENNQTAEERKKAAKERAYKKDEPKRLEAKKIINDIYEGNAKKPQTGTQKGALIKEFHDRQELSKDTVDYKIMSSDLASIGILMNTSDYKLKKEFPPKKGKASVGVSAKRYFTKSSNPNVVISMIIEDSLGDINYRADPEVSAAENAFYEFTGPEGAKNALLWIKENLSADLNNTIEEKIKDSTTEIASEEFGNVILTSKTNAQVNATVAKNEKQQDFNDALDKQGLLRGGLDPFKVDSDMRNFSLDNYGRGRSNVSLAAMKPTLNKMGEKGLDQSSTLLLSMPMYSMAQKALRNGQLKTALNIIAGKSYGKRNRELAKGFSKYIGSTKVEVVDNLRLKETGNKVSGLFDPQTNTIKLDSKTGLNNHTLFHELTHATTSATLANPSHPLSKQVTMLYNAVKDRLGTVYGSRNTEEFLAEAISNSEFRKDLATIYVKKEPYSSLDKFLHALNNFVRKYILGKETITLPDFKGYTQFRSPLGMFDITNAQEEVTRLVNEINAPSPKNRDAFELGLEDANAIITDLQNISEKQKGKYNPKKFAKEVTALTTGTAGGLGAKARQLLLQLLPMQATGDLLNYQDRDGSKNFDGLVMQKVLFDQEAGVVKLSERIEGSIENIKRNIPRGKLDNFNKVVSLSSRFQVDPSKGRKAYEKDPEKVEVWQTMQPMWNELGDKGKEAYQDLRNVYVTLFNKLKDVIYGRIDGLDLNKGAKKQLKEKVYGQFFDRNNIEVYFPLVRTGSYWIEFQANDPNKNNALEQVIMAFESEGQRRKAISTLKSEYNIDAKAFQKTDARTKVFDRAPSDSFMAQALDILQKGKIEQKIQDEFMNLFIESLPETSFAKSFSPRKGTLGFNEDAVLALKTKGYNLARQIERLRHAPEIRKEIQRLEEVQRENTSNIGFTAEIIQELIERGKFALNPPPDNLARNVNRFAFGMTLGLNISSSFVNLSQIPLVMFPYLGGKYGYGKSTKEIFKNFSILKNSGFKREIATAIPDGKGGYKTQKVQAAPSWDNYYNLQKDGTYKIREDVKNNPKFKKEFIKELEDMQALVEAASAQLGKSIFFDTLGIQGIKRGTSIFDSASMYSAFLFHQVERFNRQVALTTSYKLELDRLNGKGKYPPSEAEAKLSQKQKQQIAAENAIYQAQKINGGSLLVTAPRLAQKGLGRVALMFKSYGIQMYATMFQIMYDGAYNAWKGLGSSDVEARRQARIALKQMIGITGSSIALAGIQGSIIGTFIWMANAVLWANWEEDETAESIVRGYLGEGWWKGPIVHASGVDISARIGLSNLLWRSNPYSGDQSLPDKLWETFGGPAGSVLNQQARAVGELASALQNKGGNYEKAFLGMLPVAIRNAYTGIFDYGIAGEATNRRGDAIIDDITKSEAVWKFMGFESKRKTFQQEYSQIAKNIERNVIQGKSLLLKRSNVARRQNDIAEMQRVEKAIAKYNRRYPLNMITLQDRMRSWKRFNETTQDIVGGVYINPRSRPIIDQNISDWNMNTGLFDFI